MATAEMLTNKRYEEAFDVVKLVLQFHCATIVYESVGDIYSLRIWMYSTHFESFERHEVYRIPMEEIDIR